MKPLVILTEILLGVRIRERAVRVLLIMLLSLSIVFPAAFQPVKILLFLLIVVMVLVPMLFDLTAISCRLYALSCLYAIIGLAWSLYGEIRGNPGAVSVTTVMVFYPLLIPLCASQYKREDSHSLYKLLLTCTWVIVATDLVYTLSSASYPGHLLQTVYSYAYRGNLAQTLAVNTDTYVRRFQLPNVNSILFLLPFFISSLFFPRQRSGKLQILLVVLFTLLLAVIAGRRGLLVSMIAGPVIAFTLTINRSRRGVRSKEASRWWFLIIALVISSFLYFTFEWVGTQDSVKLLNSIYNFSENEGNLERVYQFQSLTRGILENPLFGQGGGAAADYLRSSEQPWTYELSYIAIIFQYGLLGFLLYTLGIAFLLFHLIDTIKKNGRSSFEYYCLSAFIAFLIANATNPYIFEFDSMWIMFLPYAIINREFVVRSRGQSLLPSTLKAAPLTDLQI